MKTTLNDNNTLKIIKMPKTVLLAILTTIFFWASSYVGIRLAIKYYTPEALSLMRFLAASFFLGIYALISGMSLPQRKDLPLILLTGLLGFTLYNWTLNGGTKTVTAGVSCFLISTAPIFTTLFSYFFLKEKLNNWGWLGILTSFLGLGLITLSENTHGKFNTGVFLVLTAAILISLYNILQKRLLKNYPPLEATTYSIWAGTIFMLIFLPDLLKEFGSVPFSIKMVVVYLGIFPAAIGYLLWSYALSRTSKTAYVASFMYLTPLLTLIIGWVCIKEIPYFLSIIGGLIVLGGMILTNVKG